MITEIQTLLLLRRYISTARSDPRCSRCHFLMSAKTGSDNGGFWFKLESDIAVVSKKQNWIILRTVFPTAAEELALLCVHAFVRLSVHLCIHPPNSSSIRSIPRFHFFLSSAPFCAFISINLFRGPSIIHLPSREVFPEGKLLWRPAWPRAASD